MPPQNKKSPNARGKRLSCKRCQYRKLKCSRTEPCTSCVAASTACEYRDSDKKRTPASSEYCISLEQRISWLESFIISLQDASYQDRDQMLQSISLGRPAGPALDPHQQQQQQQQQQPDEDLQFEPPSLENLEHGLDGALIYHGATSIYRTSAFQNTCDPRLDHRLLVASIEKPESNFEHVMEHFGISMEGDTVIRALTQFFKWQYPHFMFVYREAFLRDHFGPRQNCKYWSSALLMSLCALGLLMSEEEDDQRLSGQFFLAAESIVIVSGLTRPSICMVQAFLCLAFYEIGRGNLSKGWGFSGIAFRMAQDLGFQRDPKNWISHDSSLATNEDVEIRRRIYWGCFISDKLISLILGRPVQLAYDAAEVDPLETLPDGPSMEYWRPVGFDDSSSEAIGGSSNIPYVKEQIRLSRIVESMMSTMFSPGASLAGIARRSHLDKLNLDLCQWRDTLPDFAKCNRWGSTNSVPVPGVIALHLFFHSARIALNYDPAIVVTPSVTRETSRQYCTTSAQDILFLIRTYRLKYGLQYSPLVLVYAAVQAIRAINALGISEEYGYLLQSLGECAETWSLASQVPLGG